MPLADDYCSGIVKSAAASKRFSATNRPSELLRDWPFNTARQVASTFQGGIIDSKTVPTEFTFHQHKGVST